MDGREVLDRLLPDVGELLSPGGTFLLLLLEQNKPEEVAAALEAQGLTCRMMSTRSADEERLHVLRAIKPPENHRGFVRANSQMRIRGLS